MFEELAVLPTATGIIARLAVRRLEAAGIDPNPLLAAVGLNRVLVFDDNRISALSQVELLTLAGQALKDDWIGITLASAFDLRELGLLYYVAASAQRLGDAFQRLDRYLRLANEALDLHVSVASECRIGVTYTGIARHLDRHQAEFLAVTFLRLCRQLVGSQITPSRVEFVHHRSGDLSPLRRAFGCVPSFGEHVDEVCFASATFNLPLVGADSYLSNLMVKACDDALTKRPHNASPLRIQVENAIAPLLPHAEAKAARIAKQIGIERAHAVAPAAGGGLDLRPDPRRPAPRAGGSVSGRPHSADLADRLAARLPSAERAQPCLPPLARAHAAAISPSTYRRAGGRCRGRLGRHHRTGTCLAPAGS